MEYLFTFLEGIASFISPCLFKMITIYILYFIEEEEKKSSKKIINALGFVLGFTLVFLILSIFASSLGMIISENIRYIKIIFGIIIIFLGLNYMEAINIKFLNKTKVIDADKKNLNFLKAILFGAIFSISWTPCIGTFLSSALLLVAKHQDMLKGILLMLVYSIGLGIPFVVSVALIEKLKQVFNVIKKNYNIIKKVSGVILIVIGIYTIFF